MEGLGRRARVQLLQTLVGAPAFAGLQVGDPGDSAAAVNEPTIGTNGYARVAITWSSVSTPIAGEPAILANSNTLTFTSTGPWAAALTQPVSLVTVWDASTGTAESSFVGTCALAPARLIDRAGIVITIPAGALQLTIGLED